MNEDNKKTVVDGRNPWAQSEDDRPTVADGPSVEADSPTERSMQPTPFQQVYPQQRPTPPGTPYSPPPVSPPPAPPDADSRTVMMHTDSKEVVPLAWLAIVEGSGGPRGTVFPLQRETVVGRTSGAVLLRDPAVSGQHLKIRLEPSELDPKIEEFVLYDMASANGTFVGDYETCKKEANRVYRYVLSDGLYIQIGKTMLVFKHV